VRAMTGAHEDRTGTSALARNDVQAAIADCHGALRIQRQLTACPALSSRMRVYGSRTSDAIPNDRVRMMRAVIVAIDPRVDLPQVWRRASSGHVAETARR
jgi:hypothetical protein